ILYFVLVFKCFKIGRVAIAMDRYFSGLVAQGVGIWIGFQALFNLCVCLGLLPTKGLTLPMISYGGSAMVITLSALGLVFRVDYENRQLMRGLPISGVPTRGYV
ncbi:MAG TPA: FtsW/RodA/SpoVE family cell cycle protein, partial [Oligella sp.]|nr:FtsW/RodA/SpoVE family cell cycle protein [Oligella sp.]